MKTNLEKFIEQNKNILTFYHEYSIPSNPFFIGKANLEEEKSLLIVSSPSRMGNHALLAMLDNHPQLPRVPGEDAFFTYSFINANYDLNDFIHKVNSTEGTNYIMGLAGDTGLDNKWKEHARRFSENDMPDYYNGVQYDYTTQELNNKDKRGSITASSSVDFQETLINVNYEKYEDFLIKGMKSKHFQTFKELFFLYGEAFFQLDPQKKDTIYQAYMPCSGLRIQSLWACEYIKNTKIVASIRDFDTYAMSMLKSFYKTDEPKPEYIKEAWEQWYHKVVDYFYLKVNYPEKVYLVAFEDIISDTEMVARHIAKFLDVDFHENLLEATVFGTPVKGNSSTPKGEENRGKFYKSSTKKLPREFVPDVSRKLMKSFDLIAYDKWKKN